MSEELTYIDGEGNRKKVRDCKLYQDKVGSYLLWSGALRHNIAYKIKGREDCFLAAIDNLLFAIHLRDKKISELQKIADLASAFADQIKPD